MPVTVIDYTDRNIMAMRNNIAFTLRLALEEIHRNSDPVTPWLHGNLRKGVMKYLDSPTVGIIEWRMPYAQYQERGMRADGSRPVMNYTTPGTHAHFAEESVAKAMADFPEFAAKGGIR